MKKQADGEEELADDVEVERAWICLESRIEFDGGIRSWFL
jgi:hypothetical protein